MVQPASDNRGFAALVGVLLFGTVAVTIASALLLSGIRSARIVLAARQGYEAKALAQACADVALSTIHGDADFTGAGSLTLGNGSCTYTVNNTGGEARTVSVSSSVGNIMKSFDIRLDDVSPLINVVSWDEV